MPRTHVSGVQKRKEKKIRHKVGIHSLFLVLKHPFPDPLCLIWRLLMKLSYSTFLHQEPLFSGCRWLQDWINCKHNWGMEDCLRECWEIPTSPEAYRSKVYGWSLCDGIHVTRSFRLVAKTGLTLFWYVSCVWGPSEWSDCSSCDKPTDGPIRVNNDRATRCPTELADTSWLGWKRSCKSHKKQWTDTLYLMTHLGVI